MLMGQAYLALRSAGMIAEAKAELQQALNLDPDLFWARFYLARVYIDVGRNDKAKEELERGLVQRPNVPHFLALARAFPLPSPLHWQRTDPSCSRCRNRTKRPRTRTSRTYAFHGRRRSGAGRRCRLRADVGELNPRLRGRTVGGGDQQERQTGKEGELLHAPDLQSGLRPGAKYQS